MRLRDLLADTPPIQKSHLDEGGEGNDLFMVQFDVAVAEEIMEHLIDARAESVASDSATTSEAGHLAMLIGAWVRYIDFRDDAS
ncbi:MAG TPA: hypothetical protein VLG74_06630 [Blastocatellia bacterium]|nr:hypothetical protein [Blastocatellia bacterium]